jgi:molecular chaperone GrpE (heat shock protein)
MHKGACPRNNNPYADCICAALEQWEHTQELRRYNDNAPTAETVMRLQAEIEDLRERLEQAERKLAAAPPHSSD